MRQEVQALAYNTSQRSSLVPPLCIMCIAMRV